LNRDLVVKIEKWLIWGAILGILFLLRHLFPVIFITFVLTYIGSSAVAWLTRRFPWRRLNLALIYVLMFLALIGSALLVVPRMFEEGRSLARAYVAQPEVAKPGAGEQPTVIDRQTQKLVDAVMIEVLGEQTFRSYRSSDSYGQLLEKIESSVEAFIPRIVAGVREFMNGVFAIVFQFLLAIIFSFLILWDLPRLQRSVRSFGEGRTAEIYAEIAPGVSAFVTVLGRALEAQSMIAVVNTVLTAIGFYLIGIPSIALLAPIVFFCSYIPVFGVILSSLPAALLAFRAGGLTMVLWLIVMVLVVHAVEAYALNPLIFGRHLKMHPVAVLVILLVAEHLFGVWGLVLAVPIAAFVLRYVLRGESVEQITGGSPLPAPPPLP
jgi:predicted PurR-regulated permease PerM